MQFDCTNSLKSKLCYIGLWCFSTNKSQKKYTNRRKCVYYFYVFILFRDLDPENKCQSHRTLTLQYLLLQYNY